MSDKKEADELTFLRWFKQNADFGPADGDVHIWLEKKFTEETGLEVPEGWKWS